MTKLEKTYVRKRNKIFYEDGKTLYQEFPSISAAKHRSRMLQGGGRGNAATVNRVIVDRSADPKPKRNGKRQDDADRFLTEALRQEQAARIAQNLEHKVKQSGPNTISLRKPA